jgi:hypothetical protein
MHYHVGVALEPERCPFAPVGVGERKLERGALRHDSQALDQAQVAQHLVLAVAPLDEALGVRACAAGAVKPRAVPGAHAVDHAIHDLAAAVHLERQVVAARLDGLEKRGQRRRVAGPLGQPREAGKLDEVVKVAAKPPDQLARPRQADEGDAGRGVLGVQRAQRRYGAEKIAQLQGAHHCDLHFSSTNGPIASASIGEVQKHSTASRGVHTTGSERVLNEVFTSTGTPVRLWNALMRS